MLNKINHQTKKLPSLKTLAIIAVMYSFAGNTYADSSIWYKTVIR